MISVPLPEAFLYDLFSIASIKTCWNPSDVAAQEEAERLSTAIASEVGKEVHWAVLGSEEFATLRRINEEIYVRNDEIKVRPITAEDMAYTDAKVGQRWLAKRALQRRWFPTQPLTEQKYGYPKEAVNG